MHTVGLLPYFLLVLFFTTELFFFSQRLKKLVPRQVDVNFETLVEKYQTKQRQQEEMAFKAKYVF